MVFGEEMTELDSLSFVALRRILCFCTKGFMTGSYPWPPLVSVRGGGALYLKIYLLDSVKLEAHFQDVQRKRSLLLRQDDHNANIR